MGISYEDDDDFNSCSRCGFKMYSMEHECPSDADVIKAANRIMARGIQGAGDEKPKQSVVGGGSTGIVQRYCESRMEANEKPIVDEFDRGYHNAMYEVISFIKELSPSSEGVEQGR